MLRRFSRVDSVFELDCDIGFWNLLFARKNARNYKGLWRT